MDHESNDIPITSLPTDPPEGREVNTSPTQTSSPGYSTFHQNPKAFHNNPHLLRREFSPISSFIFLPAIDALSQSLHTSVERVNLTITSYMIVAGVAPAIMGNMADTTGRRPVYLLIIGIYCAANVGLALQTAWVALFVLQNTSPLLMPPKKLSGSRTSSTNSKFGISKSRQFQSLSTTTPP